MVYISKELRQFVLQRSKYHCEYCKLPQRPSGIPLELDHIEPVSADGQTVETNLCAACRNCNGAKADFQTGIDPDTKTEQHLFNPRTQQWLEHFAWSEDGTEIIGLTHAGRATIVRLNMNQDLVVESHGDWRKLGLTPPTS